MTHRHELSDLRKTNDRSERKRQHRASTDRAVARMRQRTVRRRQRRDQCRLLALLTGTGVLRSW